MLAVLAWEDRRLPDALAWFDRLLTGQPDFAHARRSRGIIHLAMGDRDLALADLDAAVALDPDNAEGWFNRGTALWKRGHLPDALASYDTAVRLQPGMAAAWSNRALPLVPLGQTQEALASVNRALALEPGHAPAWNNLGSLVLLTGARDTPSVARVAQARACFGRALAIDPQDALARWNQATCDLASGKLTQGWAGYEARHAAPALDLPARGFPQPQWVGEADIAGKTILLHAEQGFGDTIQFVRYAPMLAQRCRVILEVPEPLRRLLTGLPGCETIAAGAPLPLFDLHCPLPSLPLAFGTTLETIPNQVPYLRTDPDRVALWHARLANLPGQRAGLVWAGNARPDNPDANAVDRRRSITLDHYAPLAAVPGISFVSLQVGPPVAPPPGLVLHDWTAELTDFADTAELIAALDLVITVDTAVAHLAGALGKPVWILNRFDACWRWLLDRTDSPWYPSARLFRQPSHGDWDSVIRQVAAALRERIG